MATRPDEVVPDDQSASFLNRRQEIAGADVDSRFQQLLGSRAEQATEAETEGGGIVRGAGRAALDVGRGIVELPRAVATGVRDAAQNTYEAGRDLSLWMRDTLRMPDVFISPSFRPGMPIDFNFVSRAELDAMQSRGERTGSNLVLPDIEDPKSMTGRMAKGIAQFLTGFLASRYIPGMSGASGLGGQTLQAAGRGAIADFAVFDPQEARLSNLVQQFPALRNPVTEYLSADPEDGEFEGRFKNVIEGLGVGVMTEGLLHGLRTLRARRLAGATESAARRGADVADVRPLDAAEFDVLGPVDAPAVTLPGSRAAGRMRRSAAATEGANVSVTANGADDVFINFRRIETPEDVQGVMQSVADAYRTNIDSARRGVRTFEDIKLSADQEDAWSLLMERRVGEPLNAEQSVAARRLWVSSAEKLTEVARIADQAPSEANLFAFRRMLATHHAIQSEVIAARTETARALSSWRIPVGGGREITTALQDMLERSGGADLARDMAGRISRLADAGMTQELDEFVRGSAMARTKDAVLEAWINGLLSGPKTHVVNAMSNATVAVQQMYERAVGARIGSLLGDGGVEIGEATAQWDGLINGLRDAFRNAGKSFMTGETGYGLGKVEMPRQAAITSELFGLSSSGWLGRTVDTLANNVVRLPGRALAASDEFFKTIGYRMELHAQAARQAAQEVRAGQIAPDGLRARVAEIVANPPENIRMASVGQATYQTFTNTPGQLAQGLSKVANKVPFGRVLLPFIRTPANILRYTFERTPLAPLFSQFRADIAAGGARRDLALARMGTGSAIMMMGADMALSGNISGGGPASPSDRQALQRTGWQPYSVKIGDRWFAYNRLDPLGMTFGLAADMVEILAHGDAWKEGASADEMLIAAVAAVGNNTMSKTYLSGLSDFFEAMADPRRSSESYAQRLAGSLVPTGVAEIARQVDPYMREVRSWVDAMRARTPGLSDSLPVRRDLWGRPMTYQSGMGRGYDLVSPVYSREENPEPIDEEMLRLESTVSMPSTKVSFDGVTVDLNNYPGVYSRYLELAGNELKHPAWNLGAKDYLNAVISGDHEMSEVYRIMSDGPDGGKDVFIRDTIRDYQERARQQLLSEFPELEREVTDRSGRRTGLIASL